MPLLKSPEVCSHCFSLVWAYFQELSNRMESKDSKIFSHPILFLAFKKLHVYCRKLGKNKNLRENIFKMQISFYQSAA
jgi:hypothetical protein